MSGLVESGQPLSAAQEVARINNAAIGGTIQATATGGTTARTVASRLGDTVSPKDFGAVVDGTTDDTVAIQAAFSTGLHVRMNPGNYKIGAAGLNITTAGQVIDCTGAKFTHMGGPIRLQALRTKLINFSYTGSDALNNGVIVVGDSVTSALTAHYWEIENPQITATAAKYGIVIANGSLIGNIYGGTVVGNSGTPTANSRGLFLGDQVQSVNCWGTNFVSLVSSVEMRGCDGVGFYQCDLGDGPATGYYVMMHAIPVGGDPSPFGTNVYPNAEGSWWGSPTQIITNLVMSGCYMELGDIGIYAKTGLQLKSSTFTSCIFGLNTSSPNAKVGTRVFKSDIPIEAVNFTGNTGQVIDYIFELNSGFVTGLYSINNGWDDVGRGTAHVGVLATGSGAPERLFSSEVDGNGYVQEKCGRGRVIGASGDKIGFFGLATPVVQQANSLMPDTILENLGLRAAGGWKSRIRYIVVTGVNLNSAATDVATITGLPAKYKVGNIRAFDASTSLTTATVDVRDASGGGGNTLVSAAGLATCTTAVKIATLSLASPATTDYLTAGTIYIRNVTAQGSAATASFEIVLEDLTP